MPSRDNSISDAWASGPGAKPRASELLAEAQAHERSGRISEALDAYHVAIASAERSAENAVLAEALRRLSIVHHHQNDGDRARALCQRSYETALAMGESGLAAEALNTLGGYEIEHGAMRSAEEYFERALKLGGANPRLRCRIEQNLGILATIRGDHAAALRHYGASLEAFQAMGDDKGCAIAYHNLGMISADRKQWADAERYYEQSRTLAERIGDVHLQGLCLLNHSEVHIARQAYELARRDA